MLKKIFFLIIICLCFFNSCLNKNENNNKSEEKNTSQFVSENDNFTDIGIINDDNIRVRSEPNLNGEIITVLKRTEKVKILQQNEQN
jgi:hypothetical protein